MLMRKTIGLVVCVFTAAAMTSIAACSGDDDDNGGSGGTYSTGGTGGSTGGTGGSTGGTGGSTGGTGGTGGSTAGTGGTGGTTDAGAVAEEVTPCPATVAVTIQAVAADGGFAFSPSTATIAVGDVVKFQNMTGVQHNSKSGTGGATPAADGKWDVDLDPGDGGPGPAKCVQIKQAGTYPFFCEYHPTEMTGTVTVH